MTKISEVTFYPIKPTEKGLIGFSTCIFDEKIFMSSISVYTTLGGDIRLLFPNKSLPDGKDVNVYYPINKETYEEIRCAVSDKVESIKGGVV